MPKSPLDRVVHFVSNAVSSKKLFLYIFSFTLIWIGWNKFSPVDRFDQALQGYPNLVLIYTIYFGLVEGIMKVVQGQQQKSDDARKEILDQILKETYNQTNQIHNQTKVVHNLVKVQLVLGKKTLEILEGYSRKRKFYESRDFEKDLIDLKKLQQQLKEIDSVNNWTLGGRKP